MITPQDIAESLETMAQNRAKGWRTRMTNKLARPFQEQGLFTIEKSNQIDEMVSELFEKRLEQERSQVIANLFYVVNKADQE